MKKKTIELTFTKSTKGTHIYGSEAIGLSIYFPKAMFDGEAPAALTMTVEGKK